MKVAVAGLGFVGLPLTLLLAESGHHVVGYDVDSSRVGALQKGRNPLGPGERDIDELLEKGHLGSHLLFTTKKEEMGGSEVYVLAVQTPIDEKTHRMDQGPLASVIRDIARNLTRGSLVLVESTLAPNTMRDLILPELTTGSGLSYPKEFGLAYSPERVTSGKLIYNMKHVDKLLGVQDAESERRAVEFYKTFHRAALHVCDWVSAEVAKTAENAYWDVQIGFANELALLCERYGASVWKVRELVNSCPQRQVLLPGTGVGGACIPKDPWLLLGEARLHGVLEAARSRNSTMPDHVVEMIRSSLAEVGRDVRGSIVTILGLAYRGGSSDWRASPSLRLEELLRAGGAEVRIHDPLVEGRDGVFRDVTESVKGADCLVISTAHEEYLGLDLGTLGVGMRTRVLVDGRGVVSSEAARKAGFTFAQLGLGIS